MNVVLRAVYTFAFALALPLILLRLMWRSRKEPGYRKHLRERFGRGIPSFDKPVLWLHCVSVGETRAAKPLVDALLARYPDHALLLTHTTATGRATSETLFGERVTRVWFPYDLPWFVNRFLDATQPRLACFMETEVWPNMIAACRRRGIPTLLANARLSEKSFAGYRRFGPLARHAWRSLDAIAAQTESDAARIRALGASDVRVFGSVKFDITAPEAQLTLARTLRERCGMRPIVLAASTREGEEALLLDAWKELGDEASLLVIVPRHPQRFDEVALLARERGFSVARRSENQAVPARVAVLIGDSMGEMFAYYAASDVAFIGGSLLPLGGQNLIEACAVGCPVLIGPHTFNFADIAQLAIASGAARRVANARECVAAALAVAQLSDTRKAMADAGRAFAGAHRGATARHLQLIETLLARSRAVDAPMH